MRKDQKILVFVVETVAKLDHQDQLTVDGLVVRLIGEVTKNVYRSRCFKSEFQKGGLLLQKQVHLYIGTVKFIVFKMFKELIVNLVLELVFPQLQSDKRNGIIFQLPHFIISFECLSIRIRRVQRYKN